jgi:hypothetical protein
MRTRAIFNGHAFDRMAPGSIYEVELQKLLLNYVPILFPNHEAFLVDPLIKTQIGDGRPDIILISTESPAWTIIEVETEDHTPSHIARQLAVFQEAGFDEGIYKRILAEKPEVVSAEQVATSLQTRPRVALLMHGSAARIAEKVGQDTYDIVEFDVYSGSSTGNIITWDRISGELRPTHLRLERVPASFHQHFWRCRFSDLLDGLDSRRSRFELDGDAAEWTRTASGSEWLYREPDGVSLPSTVTTLTVYCSPHGDLVLKPTTTASEAATHTVKGSSTT